MAYITKKKIRELITSAPAGVESGQLIQGLRDRGHTLEGFNQPAPTTAPQRLGQQVRQVDQSGERKRTFSTAFGVGGDIADIGIGAAKGAASTAIGLGRLINEQILKKIPGVKGMVQDIEQPDILEPEGGFQKFGFGAEQVAEFIPAGGAKTLTKAAPKFFGKAAKETPRLIKAGKGIAKGTAKTLAEGADIAARSAAQRGDADNVLDDFLLGASTIPLVGAVKGINKAITGLLPEKLYGQVFKQAKDDLRLAYRSVAKGGEMNPTLAKEILDRNVFGTSEGMATYMFRKYDDIEETVQALSRRKTFNIPRKKDFIDTLDGLGQQFGKGFFSERGKKANKLVSELRATQGESIPMNLGLRIRRFLDKLRNSSSFKLDPSLTLKQEELKIGADTIRKSLAKQSDEFAKLMNEERIMIEGVDAIITDAVARKNRRLLGLTDVLLGGGGLATGIGLGGIGAAGAVRGFQQPAALTGLGVGLKKAGEVVKKSPLSAQKAARGTIGLTKQEK